MGRKKAVTEKGDKRSFSLYSATKKVALFILYYILTYFLIFFNSFFKKNYEIYKKSVFCLVKIAINRKNLAILKL